jgi:lipopolysaccharide/colanic/teichoic acid biosynthesis glycosyltransferase
LPLAILIVELPKDRAAPRDIGFVARVLKDRLRITDTAGMVSERCVGVLLPDTSKSGAWKVASDICGVYPVGHDRPNCDVLVYPDDVAPWIDATAQREEQPADTSASLDGVSLFESRVPRLKRAIDLIGATFGLVLAAPLLLLVAVAIKLTSRGPVFYTQEREGLGGRRFRMVKLRTMRLDAEHSQATLRPFSEQDGPAFKMSHDPRTTWLGRWLRRASVDELPQFWNVLRGEMSLVGPRPLPTLESLQCAPWQRQRLTVMPGMTCIWQVRGRNTVSFDEWMRMDLQYVRKQSISFDLRLLLTTAPAIVLKHGPR